MSVFAGRPVFRQAFVDSFGNGRGSLAISIYKRITYTDGVTTSGSKRLTSATAAFSSADEGKAVTAQDFPSGVTIETYISPTEVDLSSPATATGTGRSFQIAGRQRSADLATIYSDRLKSVASSQPYIADAAGNVLPFLDPGDYDAVTVHGVEPFTALPDHEDVPLVVANQRTANYTFVLSDAGKAVEGNAATALSFTIPPNSTTPYPVGTSIEVTQVGAGAITVVAGAGVTITGDTVTPGQGGSLLLRKTGTNAWWSAVSSVRSGTFADAATTVVHTIPAAPTGTNDTAGLQALINASEPEEMIVLRRNASYQVDGLTFSGKACGIDLNGSTIKGRSGITGPTLDYTGYVSPVNQKRQRVILVNGYIESDNSAGAAKKGVYLPAEASIIIRDVGIQKTGGACLDISGTQLSDFERVVLHTPVNAKTNDIPYLYAAGPTNGNRFYGLGLRSVLASGDVGATGAVVLVNDGTYSPDFNIFYAPWIEFLHPPTNGTIFHLGGASNVLDSMQFFDSGKEAGATGTSFIRLPAVSVGNSGSNEVRGLIPGSQAGGMDAGVHIYQSRNRIVGVKGFQGTNVILESGVGFTYVFLGGEVSSATNPAVIDNSGQTTNLVIDASQGAFDIKLASSAVLPATTRLSTATGPRFLVSGSSVFADWDNWHFRTAAGVQGLQVHPAAVTSHITHEFLGRNIQKRVASTVATNSAIVLAAQSGNVFSVTLNANVTGTTISNAATGQILTIEYIQDATGGRTYVWPTNCKFAGGAAPSDTTLNTSTSVTFFFDGTNWREKSRAVAVPA